MREILFRGKRLDNGEWVEGHVYTQVYHPDTIEEEWCWYIKPIGSMTSVAYRVDPATVGQYTGLTDQNGKQIFEGDIFDWGYAGAYDKRYVVTYDAVTASFIGERGGGFVSLNGIAIKIIGNIHDNPELLEQ